MPIYRGLCILPRSNAVRFVPGREAKIFGDYKGGENHRHSRPGSCIGASVLRCIPILPQLLSRSAQQGLGGRQLVAGCLSPFNLMQFCTSKPPPSGPDLLFFVFHVARMHADVVRCPLVQTDDAACFSRPGSWGLSVTFADMLVSHTYIHTYCGGKKSFPVASSLAATHRKLPMPPTSLQVT